MGLAAALTTMAATGCYEHTVPQEPVVVELEDCGWDGGPEPEHQMVATGRVHTCALSKSGAVRCWGENRHGELGYGNTEDIGEDETPVSAGNVDVGGPVKQIAAGHFFTCALLESGAVRCWGLGGERLGYGHTEDIGDDETPASVGDVDMGGPVKQIALGGQHACALLESGTVRCWGLCLHGVLGYGTVENIGDDETPAEAGDVDVGGPVKQIASGDGHNCALLENGAVRCWGSNGWGWRDREGVEHPVYGVLGYGPDQRDIGDDETPASAGDVDIGEPVHQISAGSGYTCVLLDGGRVRCWGYNRSGQLGYGHTDFVGDDEALVSIDDVNVGGPVARVTAGSAATCAVLENGAMRCWGSGISGALGYGNPRSIGDDELPYRAGDVPLGCTAWQVDTENGHTCALLRNGAIRCWGFNRYGQLGYGHTETIGDDETPADVGDVDVW